MKTKPTYDQQKAEFYLLKLQSAVAYKQFAVAAAEMENARGGWSYNWSEDIRRAEVEIAATETALRSL